MDDDKEMVVGVGVTDCFVFVFDSLVDWLVYFTIFVYVFCVFVFFFGVVVYF